MNIHPCNITSKNSHKKIFLQNKSIIMGNITSNSAIHGESKTIIKQINTKTV